MYSSDRWTGVLDVRVVTGDLDGLHGAYMHDRRAVVLDRSLGPIQRYSTLMHELGHAFHGHRSSNSRTEGEASEWAARQMIRGCELARLARTHESAELVAHELGVLPRDVTNYLTWLARAGMWPIHSDSA